MNHSNAHVPDTTYETQNKRNQYKFADNIGTVMNHSNAHVPDTTYETQNKRNQYKFADNIGTVMNHSNAHVPDNTSENHIRSNGNILQDHKLKNTNAENVWSISDENNFGKNQKQSRSGGIKPTTMDIPTSHDVEVNNGPSIIGNKSLRGDNVTVDSNTMSENLSLHNN